MKQAKGVFRLFVIVTLLFNWMALWFVFISLPAKTRLSAAIPQRFKTVQQEIIKKSKPTILETANISDLLNYVEPGPQTLVVFDIDNTLFWPEEPEAREEWFTDLLSVYKKFGYTRAEAVKRFIGWHTDAVAKSQVFPVDEAITSILKELKEKKIHTIALTGRPVDFFGFTQDAFEALSISFKSSKAPWNKLLLLESLPKQAYFIDGILFAWNNHKGDTLEAFFKAIKYLPKVLVFIDNNKKHVHNVMETAQKLHIPKAYGLHYTKMELVGLNRIELIKTLRAA